MKLKRILYLLLGLVCLLVGAIGTVLPILPTVPFFLGTVFFFANSSTKLHDWFIHTNVYKKHLDVRTSAVRSSTINPSTPGIAPATVLVSPSTAS